jgi:hypothetical protein
MNMEKFLSRLCLAAFLFGLLYRLHPFVMDDARIARFFVTEDGYLMLTVARNLAIGNGLSVAGGEIATNGVQPLATFLFALPYMLTGGDKILGIAGVLAISAVVAVLGAWAIRRFAAAALARQDQAAVWPLLVAALWFVGPLPLLHTMNALETGLYTLILVVAALRFGALLERGGIFPMADRITFGALLGLVFLARNDGAFFVASVLLVRFVQAQTKGGLSFRQALAEAVPAGLVSLVVAAPWLAYNKIGFGAFVPISGQSQSIAAGFGSNLGLAPLKFFETMFPMLPIPTALEGSAAANALLGLVAAGILAAFLWGAIRRGGTFWVVLAAYALHAVLVFGYYGLFFGAPWFLSRYFAPLAPLLITAAVSVGLDLARRLRGAEAAPLAAGAGIGALVLSLLLSARLLLPGQHVHEHFQVVDWVEAHVAPETWMGAVQTGTLGYWHDRTINLDGKVNPAALAALRAKGDVLDYVVDSPIQYLADWTGLAEWVTRDNRRFSQAFEIELDAPDRNLSVLRRRGGPPPL